MSTLTFPTLSAAPVVSRFSLQPNTQRYESPLNRTVQTLELPGARWTATIEYRNISMADARLLKAFFARLRGMAGRFYLGDYSHKIPAGTAGSGGMVYGANQSGNSIATDGWAASQSALFLPGDYISINGELKIITQTITSNSFGRATLVFEPPLRSVPADDTAIVTSAPTCIMRLVDDGQDQFAVDPDRRPTVTFEAIEVFA